MRYLLWAHRYFEAVRLCGTLARRWWVRFHRPRGLADNPRIFSGAAGCEPELVAESEASAPASAVPLDAGLALESDRSGLDARLALHPPPHAQLFGSSLLRDSPVAGPGGLPAVPDAGQLRALQEKPAAAAEVLPLLAHLPHASSSNAQAARDQARKDLLQAVRARATSVRTACE